MDPKMIELRRADFVTIGTTGEPGRRTFFLQAAQDDLVVSLIIEKEQATALAVGISNVLAGAEALDEIQGGPQLELIHPVRPLFRVGKLNLGYDEERELIAVIAEALVREEAEAISVRIWATRDQMLALAREAVIAVASGRPICSLCHEILDSAEDHVCVRGNGRKRVE